MPDVKVTAIGTSHFKTQEYKTEAYTVDWLCELEYLQA
jgi:hypothetical protein